MGITAAEPAGGCHCTESALTGTFHSLQNELSGQVWGQSTALKAVGGYQTC